MPSAYDFAPDTWPMVGAAIAAAVVVLYASGRRAHPATTSLAVVAAVTFTWAFAAAFEVAAVQTPEKIFWHKLERWCQLVAGSGTLWFALDYTSLNRWLTRWTFAVLAAASLGFAILIITNDHHAVIWTGFSLSGDDVRPQFGVGKWIFVDYELLVGALAALVFLWLFTKSPRHRRYAALCFVGLVVTRLTYVLETVADLDSLGRVDWTAVAGASNVVLYGFLLFRFPTRELLPIAHASVIEQMREGVLIIDDDQRVVDNNPAAARILGISTEATQGLNVLRLPMFQGLDPWLNAPVTGSREIRTGTGDGVRWYSVSRSPLNAGGGLHHLVLLQDITDEKRARAEVVEQQCAVAALRERAALARELHDNLGQVLGFVRMQAQAAHDLLTQGHPSRAHECIARLLVAAHDAHTDIREYIEGTAEPAPSIGRLRSSLIEYLGIFRETSGIDVKLEAPDALDASALAPAVEAQLFRMIQESLTNVRKHAHARQVEVSVAIRDGCAEAVVRDDGDGIEPAALPKPQGHRFGLRFMRERAAEVGGSVGIRSAPGVGTEIVIRVPLKSTVS